MEYPVFDRRIILPSIASLCILGERKAWSSKLLVHRWPEARNRNDKAGKKFRNGKGISIS